MFSYFIARWRFKRAFEPDGDGFLYRRNSRSAAVYVSSQEHSAFLRQFTRNYWKHHLTLFCGWIAALFAAVAALIFTADDLQETASVVAGYAAAVAFIAGSLLIDRRLFDEPAKALSKRPPILPARTWNDVRKASIGKASWPRLIISTLVVSGLAWVTFPSPVSPAWWPFAWTAYFGFCGIFAVRNVWQKLRLDAEN